MGIHERLKKIREYRNYSQDFIAKQLSMTKQAWGRKERGEIDGFSPDDFEKFLKITEIDARWLFGQMGDAPIEEADLRVKHPQENYADLVREVSELKELYKPREEDPLVEKVRINERLREIVDQIKNLEGNTLSEIKAMIFAYLYHDSKLEKGVDSGRKHA